MLRDGYSIGKQDGESAVFNADKSLSVSFPGDSPSERDIDVAVNMLARAEFDRDYGPDMFHRLIVAEAKTLVHGEAFPADLIEVYSEFCERTGHANKINGWR